MKKRLSAAALAVVLSAATTVSTFAGAWEKTGTFWKWSEGNGVYMKSGWKWLDGNKDGTAECYYFDNNGNMLAGTTTPDGYTVNQNGAWTQNGSVKTKQGTWVNTAYGWAYMKADGEFAKNGWMWIDGNNDGTAECYYFTPSGFMQAGGTTPDGYKVSKDGAWIGSDGKPFTKAFSVKKSSGPVTGGRSTGSSGGGGSSSGGSYSSVSRSRSSSGSSSSGSSSKPSAKPSSSKGTITASSKDSPVTGRYERLTSEEKAAVDKKMDEIFEKYNITDDKSDLEKEALIYEYIRENIHYATDIKGGDSGHESDCYGALVNNGGECDGQSDAFLQLARKAGLNARLVWNRTHAWNAVELGGQWYIVDVTNDIPNCTAAEYKLALAKFSHSGEWNIDEAENADGTAYNGYHIVEYMLSDAIDDVKGNGEWYGISGDGVSEITDEQHKEFMAEARAGWFMENGDVDNAYSASDKASYEEAVNSIVSDCEGLVEQCMADGRDFDAAFALVTVNDGTDYKEGVTDPTVTLDRYAETNSQSGEKSFTITGTSDTEKSVAFKVPSYDNVENTRLETLIYKFHVSYGEKDTTVTDILDGFKGLDGKEYTISEYESTGEYSVQDLRHALDVDAEGILKPYKGNGKNVSLITKWSEGLPKTNLPKDQAEGSYDVTLSVEDNGVRSETVTITVKYVLDGLEEAPAEEKKDETPEEETGSNASDTTPDGTGEPGDTGDGADTVTPSQDTDNEAPEGTETSGNGNGAETETVVTDTVTTENDTETPDEETGDTTDEEPVDTGTGTETPDEGNSDAEI